MVEREVFVSETRGDPEKMLWYLAHPFTIMSKNELARAEGERRNFKSACDLAFELLRCGIHTYSPISMTYPIHKRHPVPKDEEYRIYMGLDRMIAERCDGLILCPGWEDSFGCKIERGWFLEWKKPVRRVVYLDEGLGLERDPASEDEGL